LSLRDEAQLRPENIGHRHRHRGGSDKRYTFDGGGLKAIPRDVPGNHGSDFGQYFHESDHRTRAEGRQCETRVFWRIGQ
jgi:hypothetical protein